MRVIHIIAKHGFYTTYKTGAIYLTHFKFYIEIDFEVLKKFKLNI